MYKDLILENPSFNSFDISFVARIVPLLKPAKFEAGEYIWREGDYCSTVFFLVKGKIKYGIEYHDDKDLSAKNMLKRKA